MSKPTVDDDLAEFEALVKKTQKPPCKVAAALAHLSADDLRKFEKAVAEPRTRFNYAVLQKWLGAHGAPDVTTPALRVHYADRNCSCHV